MLRCGGSRCVVRSQLRRQEREWVQMQRLKQRADEAYGRLSADIARIKQQKVCVARLGAVAQGEGAGWGFSGLGWEGQS